MTEAATGTKTATGSEDTLATETTPGTYILCIDLANMVNGDELVIRLKTKVITAGTSREAFYAVYKHVQAQPNVQSLPVAVGHEIVATIEQTAGTNRDYPWSLLLV